MSITLSEGQEIQRDFSLSCECSGTTWHLHGFDEVPEEYNVCTYPATAKLVKLADVEYSMPDGLLIWYEENGEWFFYMKGWTTCTLEYLTPDKMYYVGVTTASVWVIPQGSPDYLSMSKQELHAYLSDGSVARDWWSLSYDSRKQLGINIIQWWSVPLGSVPYGTKSNTKPNWDPYTDPHSNDFVVLCRGDAGIRYCIMCGELDCPNDLWYFIAGFQPGQGEWYKQEYSTPFHLPVYVANKSGVGENHTICALQIGENEADFSNWIFFQYGNADIKPGNWQMPYGATLKVEEMATIDSLGQLATWVRTLASWII